MEMWKFGVKLTTYFTRYEEFETHTKRRASAHRALEWLEYHATTPTYSSYKYQASLINDQCLNGLDLSQMGVETVSSNEFAA
jgi:hypothetical protein